jgi:hypothetical protein
VPGPGAFATTPCTTTRSIRAAPRAFAPSTTSPALGQQTESHSQQGKTMKLPTPFDTPDQTVPQKPPFEDEETVLDKVIFFIVAVLSIGMAVTMVRMS